MRTYLLTKNEKNIINRFLETGDKLEGFRVLLHRCRNIKGIRGDLELIEEFVRRAS